MNLSEINIKPTYTTKLLSTGEKVRFNAITYEDKKALLKVKELDGSEEGIMNAMMDTLNKCVLNYDINEILVSDAEFLFVEIFKASVGTEYELNVKCGGCGEINSIHVDLDEMELVKSNTKIENKIWLDENVALLLKYPLLKQVRDISDNEYTKIDTTLMSSISKVYVGDESIDFESSPVDEQKNFISKFNHKTIKSIIDFQNNMPKMTFAKKHKCINTNACDEIIHIKAEDISDFFTLL